MSDSAARVEVVSGRRRARAVVVSAAWVLAVTAALRPGASPAQPPPESLLAKPERSARIPQARSIPLQGVKPDMARPSSGAGAFDPGADLGRAPARRAPRRRTRRALPISAQLPPASDAAPSAPQQVGDLTTRYRFIERYTTAPEPGKPRDLNQYRVAVREVIRVADETAQGTPDRKETTIQVIYTERPAVVATTGAVTDVVRRYEALRIAPTPPTARPSDAKPLEGLTLWYHQRPNAPPLILSLDPARTLNETEYRINSQAVYMPDLVGVLPARPSLVGDRWRVPRPAAAVLLGGRPTQGGDSLVATLLDVRKAPAGNDRVAVIGVAGHAQMPPAGADRALNARVLFTFADPGQAAAPAPGAATAAGAAGSGGAVDARGAITEVRLARSSAMTIPSSANGRLRRSLTWEMVVQRQLPPGNVGEPLAVPSPPPAPTEQNSWLTYTDPKGRFSFRHPQELQPQDAPGAPVDDNMIQLTDSRAGTTEGHVVTIILQTKTGDPAKDRASRDPEIHKKELSEEWERSHRDVLWGPSGWLPEAEWAPHKMKVYRFEAALRDAGRDTRGSSSTITSSCSHRTRASRSTP
jgi:hypothetical protein